MKTMIGSALMINHNMIGLINKITSMNKVKLILMTSGMTTTHRQIQLSRGMKMIMIIMKMKTMSKTKKPISAYTKKSLIKYLVIPTISLTNKMICLTMTTFSTSLLTISQLIMPKLRRISNTLSRTKFISSRSLKWPT